jgi:DNA uptake protein ComE-like DNA-binding protein
MKMLRLAIALSVTAFGQRAAEPLDINTAVPAQLRALPGMGDVYVRRVIDGRPYTAKNQLATRGVLPQQEYQRIAAMIVAHKIVAHKIVAHRAKEAAKP